MEEMSCIFALRSLFSSGLWNLSALQIKPWTAAAPSPAFLGHTRLAHKTCLFSLKYLNQATWMQFCVSFVECQPKSIFFFFHPNCVHTARSKGEITQAAKVAHFTYTPAERGWGEVGREGQRPWRIVRVKGRQGAEGRLCEAFKIKWWGKETNNDWDTT